MHRSCLFLAILLLTGLAVQAQSLLWQVSGNGLTKPSYLFGTYHILRDSYLKQDTLTRRHFEQAEGIVVEMVFDEAEAANMRRYALMPDNNLIRLIEANDYKLVADEFNTVTGQELSFYNQFKPIIVATALSVAYARQRSDTLTKFSGQPIDLYFVKQAQAARKPLKGLETLAEQLTLLYDRQPVEQQAEQLVRLVKQKNVPKTPGNNLTDLYLRADLDGMWALFQRESDSPADLYALIDSRNLRWMTQLVPMMAERSTFIAVGVGHLPGPNGLLQLLRKAGYVVEAVK
ncbi:TraB/GumN family protein [Fibrivirga algicola]|uniref:TraB/GumN family protein n=1 Tax=Fibrivirga algicola TaxID=2950420 RepID=A0ABX0QGD3_9BACT|nr:TraB/GumN family protein [Fibrivirga algicola]NID11450.1 TraB/GumN family protein [Fibrivirga algicola]